MPGDAPPMTDGARFRRALCVAGVAALLALIALGALARGNLLTAWYLRAQDLPVIAAILAGLIVGTRLGGREPYSRLPMMTPARMALACLAVGVVGLLGFTLVMGSYAVSRDEQMALFDARIFAAGELAGRIPADWIAFKSALNTVFLDRAIEGARWASDYLPVNAALHAVGVTIGLPALVGPLLAALALWATWQAARMLWPNAPEAVTVTTIVLLASAQFLVTAMTSYAMNALLALNMLWLLLVWKDRWWSHTAALAVGFAACGTHQIAYHPMFAAPVLALLVLDRRWRLAAIYAAAYVAMLAFWDGWLTLRADLIGAAASGEGANSTAARASAAWAEASLTTMAANLARLVSWQHLLFLPLLMAGAWRGWHLRDRRLLALVGVLLLAIVIKTVLRPYQGHGWGYRYMHGALGATALLCGAGWIELRERGAAHARAFGLATAASLLVLLPVRLWQAHGFTTAYARPAATARAANADVVVIDDRLAPFAQDIAINDPFLRNRPVMLLASQLSLADVASLCARYRVAAPARGEIVAINRMFGIPVPREAGNAPIIAAIDERC